MGQFKEEIQSDIFYLLCAHVTYLHPILVVSVFTSHNKSLFNIFQELKKKAIDAHLSNPHSSCVGGSHEPMQKVFSPGNGSSSLLELLLVSKNVRRRMNLHNLAQVAAPSQMAYDEPSTSACPPHKRQRTSRGALMIFLKEEAKKEDENFQASTTQSASKMGLLSV